MVTLRDCFGHSIALTAERLAHILEHPEMLGLEVEIRTTLQTPQLVRHSRSEPSASLFYRFYQRTVIGGKWLCVVVKYSGDAAFVVTAYLTDQPKPGEDLWPTK
jgi:hypothetical protein